MLINLVKRWVFRIFLRWHWFLKWRTTTSYRVMRILIMTDYRDVQWDIIWKGNWKYEFRDNLWTPTFMWYEAKPSLYQETVDCILDGRWS